jgi:hypothetical protein
MRANFALEDMPPDAEDLALQERYIEGTASLDDLLTYARAYASEHRRREDAVNFARASVGLEGFMPSKEAEVHARRFINGEIRLDEFVCPKDDELGEA